MVSGVNFKMLQIVDLILYIYLVIAFKTPCATRWNTTYDSLSLFINNYKSLEIANTLFNLLGLPSLTKEDIELLNEYMLVMKPISAVLDIFQGEKGCFLGLGIVLPLLTKPR